MKNYNTLLHSTENQFTSNTISQINNKSLKDYLKARTKQLVLFVFLLFSVIGNGWGQVTTNGGSGLAATYPSLAAAITALNVATITSPVVITLTASNPQTAPAGGYSITATGTVTNTITITGNSNTITAPAQTAGNLNDAIFKIIGGDNITVQGFTMQERVFTPVAADRTAGTNTMTEFGVALFYATTTNGAQNNTIQNNTISLNRTYQNTFGIYSNSTHSATAVTTSATATSTAGGNSGLKVYGNAVSNVNLGIVVVGSLAAADYNTGIDIGGSSALTGNTISNFGTTGTFSGFMNLSGTVNGILVRNSIGFNVSYNSVTSSNGGVTAGTLNGIQIPAATVAPTGTFTNNINNNTISLQTGFATGAINGINYPSGSASTTSIVNINNNNFTRMNSSVTTSGAFDAILCQSSNLTTSISNNTFTNLSVNTSGNFRFIVHTFSIPAAGSATISNNSIATAFSKTVAGGTVTITTTNGSSPTSATLTQSNNNFSNITVTGATSIIGFNNTDGASSSCSKTITGNTFNNWTGGTNAILGMNYTYWGGGLTNTLSTNTFSNITGQGAISGITIGSSFSGTNTVTFANNTLSGFSSTGTGGNVLGLSCANTSTIINISGNNINSLSSTGATSSISGIVVSNAATTNVFSNNIYNLSGSANPTVNGIVASGGTTRNIYNNLISDLRAPAANAAVPIYGINASGGTTANIYYNTVRLGTSSTALTGGAAFGVTGIGFSSTTNTTLNNNIININATAATTGTIACLRRSVAGTVNVAPSATSFIANNNIYYVNNGAWNFYYAEGTINTTGSLRNAYGPSGITVDATNNIQNDATFNTSCSLYKSFMLTNGRTAGISESASFSENNLVAVTPPAAGGFAPTGGSYAENGAVSIASPSITTDFSGTARTASTNNDIGALQFAGSASDAVPPSVTLTVFPTGSSACTSISATITDASGVNTTAGTKPRLYFRRTAGGTVDGTSFGTYPTDNSSTFNGWKYVEASNSSSPFTFDFDYALLQGGSAASGDVIQYFVTAQDLSASTNVGSATAVFSGGCPTSVNFSNALTATATNTFTVGGSLAAITARGWNPQVVTGFTADVIANGVGLPATSTNAFFDNANYNLLDASYTNVASGNPPAFALPTNGVIRSANTPGLAYQLASSSSNNSLRINSATPASLTFSTPISTPALTVLASSGDGANTFTIEVIYTDFTVETFTGIVVNDWFGGASFAAQGIGRVNAANTQDGTATNPRLYEIPLNLNIANYSKLVASVRFTRTAGTFTTNFMAVTAATTTPYVNCDNATSRLSVYGASGVSFQWQQSATAGGPYTNVVGGTGATTATYTTPALTSTTYYVCLITCGGSSTATNEVMVSTTALPTISVTPNSGVLCSGNLVAGGASSYMWSPRAFLNYVNNSTMTPTSSGTYTVTGTNAAGCSATATATITKGNIVTMGPVTSDQPSACAGGTVQLNGSATINGPVSAYGFLSSSGQTLDPMTGATTLLGSAIDNTASALTSFPAAFIFPYEGVNQTQFTISDNGVFRFGATAVSTTQYGSITGSSLLLSPWAADMGTGSNGGVSYVVTGTAPNRIFIIQYRTTHTWSTSVAINNTYQIWLYETTGVIQYRYGALGSTGTVAHGIGLSGASTTNYQSISAATGLSSTGSVTSNGTVPASGTMYTFTPPTPTFAWTNTDVSNTLSSTTITNPVATVNTTDTYTLTATGSDGCAANGSVTVALGGGTPTVTANATSTNLCVGASSTFSATISGGCSPFTYSWSDGTSIVSTASTFTQAPTATTTYTLTLTDNNGTVVTSDVTVTVNALPTIAVNNGSFCSGGTALALTASGASTYSWSPATGLSATSGSSVNASPLSTTTYTVTGTDGNGCVNTASSIVTVSTGITLSPTATPSTVCSGENSQLNVTVTAVGGGSSIKITEVTLYRIGTGATVSYPAFVTGADLVEITNISSSPIDISGWSLGDYANNAAATTHPLLTFPSGTIIPANSVAVVCLGTGTNDIANRYFNTGGTSDFWSSGSLMGVVLKNGTAVVDAVGLNSGYTFNAGSGVTASDWSGFAPSIGGFAGSIRSASTDNNTGADWIQSSAGTPQTVGTFNAGLAVPLTIASYAWSPATFLSSTTIANPTATALTASTTYSVTVTTTGGCTATADAAIIVNPNPSITLGSTSAVCQSGTTSTLNFTVNAGSPDQYIIDYDATANTQGFVDITSYTAFSASPISLTVPAGALAGTYNGTITVKNSTTGCVSSSYAFTVTINGAVVITTQPNNAVTLDGGDAIFTVAATGTGLTYQWQVNTGSGFTNISGATSASYTALGVTASMSGYQYQCIVSGSAPCASVTSTTASLTISTTAITAQPVSTTICSNGTANFLIVTSGSTPTYQWQVSTDNGSNWFDIGGETTDALSISGVTSANSLQQYRCVLSSTINSDAAIMTVYDAVVIATQPTDITICSNAASASFTVGATGSGLTYQWQVSTNGGSLWTNATGASTGATYTISSITNALNQNQYRVIVSGASPCASVTSSAATLSITGVAVASSVPSVCQGGSFTLTATPTTGSPALTYSWLCATTGSGATSAIAGSPATITPSGAGSFVYTLTSTGGGCTLTNTITVASNENPTITSAAASPASVCSGATVNLVASSVQATTGTAIVGTGTTQGANSTTFVRVGNTVGNQFKNQYLFTAAELTAAGLTTGNITSLTFDVFVSGGGTVSNLTFRIGTTALTSLTSTYVTGLTQVYTAGTYPPTGTLQVGLQTVTFNTPFFWDGTSNLVLEGCSQLATGGTAGDLRSGTTPFVSTITHTTSTTGCSSVTGAGTSSVRPNFRFGGQVGTNISNTFNWAWNTTPAITAATGTTVADNTGGSSITQTYTVTATNPTTGCSSNLSTAAITINPTPSAPDATNSASCGPNVPTGTLASTSGLTNPNVNWYTAATGGNLVLTSYTGALTTYYSNDFSSNTGIGVMTGNASLAAGSLELTPNLGSQLGALTIPESGISADKYKVTFDLFTSNVAQSGADGLSYSFGDDVSGTSTTVNAETGSGSKLKISFDDYDLLGNGIAGIRVIYGNTISLPGTTIGTNGVLAYNSTTSWTNGTVPVIIDINNLGQLTLTVNGSAIFTNLQLPASYINADKSTWKHGFKARTGGVFMTHAIDNVTIQQSSYLQATSYPMVVPATTTYYAIESNAGCSSTATPITFTVNTSPAMTLSAATSAVCAGSPSSTVTLTSNEADYTSYTWSPSSSATGTSAAGWNFAPTTATTYTLTGTNTSTGCANTATVAVSVNSLPSALTVTPSASNICVGNIQNVVATGGSMPNQTVVSENFNSGVGTFTVTSTSSSANQNWAAQANGYVYSATFSGSTNGFMMANSDVGGSGATTNTILTSPVFSTIGYTGMTLSLKEYLNNPTDTYASIEISNDNFVSNITTLRNNITTDIGSSTAFNATALAIPVAYENQASVKIRFRYVGSYDWYWAVDEFTVTGNGTQAITWSGANAFSNAAATTAYVSGTNTTSIYAKPDVTTTYTATATNSAGCTTSGTATLTLPTAGTALSQNNENATCLVSENGWIDFYHSSGRLIGSINAQGQDLGNVTITSYVDPTNALIPACINPTPSTSTTVMQRHWVITPTIQPTSNVLIRLPYSTTEFNLLAFEAFNNSNLNDDLPAETSIGLSKYSNGSASNVNSSALDNCGVGSSTYYSQTTNGLTSTYSSVNEKYVAFTIPGFSEFWLHGSATSSPLPVELISFQANCAGDKQVDVTWSTASEHNTSHFVVEKSRDGINWTILNTLGASGNSTTVIEYALTDNNVASGTTYYRLTQFDNDGVSETFNVASVNCGAQQAITSNLVTYPNPSNGSFYVDFYTQDITGPSLISVFDSRGVIIYRQDVLVEKGSNVFHIEDLEAAPGMYYIKVSNGTTTSYIVKHSLR